MSRSRRWCFTLFFQDQERISGANWVLTRADVPAFVTYMVYQVESTPGNGLLHAQGYLELENGKTFSALRSSFLIDGEPWLEGAHFEIAKGTAKQNQDYCKKDATRFEGPWEIGEISQQGKRNDISDAVDLILEGADDLELIAQFPSQFVRYNKGFDRVRSAYVVPRTDRAPEVVVLYGPSGCGKTFRATHWDEEKYYVKPSGKWWPGYSGQHTVILDEFRGNFMSYGDLLRLLDRYQFQVETKGSYTFIHDTTRRFIITTNIHPSEWYDPAAIHCPWVTSPLRRRINEYGRFFTLSELHRVNSSLPQPTVCAWPTIVMEDQPVIPGRSNQLAGSDEELDPDDYVSQSPEIERKRPRAVQIGKDKEEDDVPEGELVPVPDANPEPEAIQDPPKRSRSRGPGGPIPGLIPDFLDLGPILSQFDDNGLPKE